MLRRFFRRLWNLFGYDADFWRGPMLLGGALAAVTWTVWYFTKTPCIGDNAASGLCNNSLLAAYINVDIMSRCTAAWLGATTLTGGINAIMLERERQRTNEAQQQLVEERKRFDEERQQERQRFDEERQRHEEERQRNNEERQRNNEERQRNNEERQRNNEERQRNNEERQRNNEERQRYEERIEALINENRAERQQLMTMIAELMAAQRQQNGGNNSNDGSGQP